MLCERCQKNVATVHMKQIVNGGKLEYYLCETCANSIDNQLSFDQFFQGLLESIFNVGQAESFASGSRKAAQDTRCSCGLSYSEFQSLGKLGCANCYDTFKNQLNLILKNIHGSNKHQGKFPHKSGTDMKRKHDIEMLKISLIKAIDNEEYEQAAYFRDRIRELERIDVDA